MSNAETENLPVLQLDVISDVICPWCFIGKRKLDAALESLTDVRINLMWRPYQLYPDTPTEGADLTAKIKQRYGEEGVKKMRENIKVAAEGTNIDFAFEKIKITPNTMNAHRLIRWAASTGQQHMIAEALFSAHFEQGRNIGDVAVLLEIAGLHGMDVLLLAELFEGNNDIEATRNDDAAARDLGVHGVPAFSPAASFC